MKEQRKINYSFLKYQRNEDKQKYLFQPSMEQNLFVPKLSKEGRRSKVFVPQLSKERRRSEVFILQLLMIDIASILY